MSLCSLAELDSVTRVKKNEECIMSVVNPGIPRLKVTDPTVLSIKELISCSSAVLKVSSHALHVPLVEVTKVIMGFVSAGFHLAQWVGPKELCVPKKNGE